MQRSIRPTRARAKQTFASVSRFPRCVAENVAEQHARAQEALAGAVESLAEQERRFGADPFEKIAIRRIAILSVLRVGVEPPDPSERVKIYLSKSLIARDAARGARHGVRASLLRHKLCAIVCRSRASTFAPIESRALRMLARTGRKTRTAKG